MDIEKTLSSLTLEEKASLCSGSDFWHTQEIPGKVPSIMLSDGPNGLRKQDQSPDHLGVNDSITAICFPTASAMASSFDRNLIEEVGNALGEECQSEDVQVLLGPGVNMKRSPLCGRNFEYYSEDPYLAGEMGAAFVKGVQKNHVGVSLKHFAGNNQETKRFLINDKMDERTLHEIYLTAFEKVVKQASPWTLMCSYNRINGEYSCENKLLLTDILRKKWGFTGLVMTDWGAMNDRVKAVKAGLDLEMPSSHGKRDRLIAEAVKNGTLDEADLDKCAENVLRLVDRALEGKKLFSAEKGENYHYDIEEHHNLSGKVAAQSAVLLKNENNALPLDFSRKTAFIGEFAGKAKYQGGGSSHINCWRVDSVLDAVTNLKNAEISCCKGYNIDPFSDDPEKNKKEALRLMDEAVELASVSDTAVVFAGLSDSIESEGFDRKNIDLPEDQNELIRRVAQTAPHTVVVLFNGSPVTMPWKDDVDAILEMYLGGEAVGGAVIKLLSGEVSPSGHLAETFPKRIEDTPAYLNFPGGRTSVNYSEGVFIGYRYYDMRDQDVLFPFGFGLTYSDFTLTDLKINGADAPSSPESAPEIPADQDITVSFTLTNTGKFPAAQVPQLYISTENVADCEDTRPLRELKDFEKIYLEPGSSKEVTFHLNRRSFAYFSEETHDWFVPSGIYGIMIGTSSRDFDLVSYINIRSDDRIPFHAGTYTTVNDVLKYADDSSPLDSFIEKIGFANVNAGEGDDKLGESAASMAAAMYGETPIHSMISFTDADIDVSDADKCIDELNERNS